MAVSQAKFEAAEARLSAAGPLPAGAQWATNIRQTAQTRVLASGLPGRRDEYWKYTDPTSLTTAQAPKAALFDAQETPMFDAIDRLKIVFVDGVFDPAASDDLALEGVEIEPLQTACAADIHWARDCFGALETKGQTPVARPLAALNTALAAEGMVIRATQKVSKPISLIYLHKSENSDAMIHHILRIESGASLSVLENGPAAARINMVMEVDIADGAEFHHIRTQGRDHERRAATHIFARLGTESTFKSFTMTANGVMTRNEVIMELTGDNAIAHVAGAALGDGDFHHDDTVFITHDAVNCESRQVFKKVLRNGATGVFQGKILVKEGAQKTDGYQISQALLLDEDAQFLAKPELEIYADDVACSHGSTTGAIDEEALFYLRSRGVLEADAQDLLVLSFLAAAIEEIEDEAIAADILSRLEAWLKRRRG
ncbi:MAG: Fe-S cluster assembly protein SufD [Paracoccaceae bacterium]